jgi:hypothetical protein
MKLQLSYANVAATIALFLALGGSAVAGTRTLITGTDVQDHSLTGIDIANHSLTGTDIKAGSLGSGVFSDAALANLRGADGTAGSVGAAGLAGKAGEPGPAGPQGPPGQGIAPTSASAPDASNYQDLTPLADATLSGKGDYVIFASVTAQNTGSADDNLSCGLFSDGNEFGGGGVSIAAGQTLTDRVVAVGAIPVGQTAVEVTLKCQGGGVTTYDLSDVTMRLHDLG